MLINTVYIGEWQFNVTSSRTGERKPDDEIVKIAIPAIIEPRATPAERVIADDPLGRIRITALA